MLNMVYIKAKTEQVLKRNVVVHLEKKGSNYGKEKS